MNKTGVSYANPPGYFLKFRFSIVLLFPFVFIGSVRAQQYDSLQIYNAARTVVDTLTSKAMHGRGYVNHGDRLAADYIAHRFQDLGLLSFSADYFQSFKINVNTFPGKVEVSLDGHKLQTGKDFILHEASGSGTGRCSLRDENAKRVALVLPVDQRNKNIINPKKKPVVMVEPEKLTADFSTDAWKFPGIIFLKSPLIDTAKEMQFRIEHKLLKNYATQNVIGYVKGAVYPDSFIVFSAHYDHLGQLGQDVYFPGANDNASGCAMLLSLADYYSQPANRPAYSIAFMAFSAEEVGLVGSRYYTEHPLFPLAKIKLLLNMDIFGTGEEGVTVVNGTVFRPEFDLLKSINDEQHFIKDVKIRGKAANSDHYFFSEKGVKALFIYTMGGIKAYHDIFDRSATLPLNEFVDLNKMILKFALALQNTSHP